MSALKSAGAVLLALTGEEVLVTSRGGPGAVAGAFGLFARAIDHIGDPYVAAIPDRRAPGSSGTGAGGSTTQKQHISSDEAIIANPKSTAAQKAAAAQNLFTQTGVSP